MKIGITGMSRSGKTTLGDYLVANHAFKMFNFGDPLKHYAKELFPDFFMDGKPRKLFIDFGQGMRNIDPDIWIKKTFDSIRDYEEQFPNANILVCDVRQPNEVKRLRDEGFVIIRINATSGRRIQRMLNNNDNFSLDDLNDETEQSVNLHQVDYEIHNSGSLESLYAQIEDILETIRS